jgi:hypothetical protein
VTQTAVYCLCSHSCVYISTVKHFKSLWDVPPFCYGMFTTRHTESPSSYDNRPVVNMSLCCRLKGATFRLLRWSRGCVLASSTQVRGFKPGRSRQTFQDEEIPSTPSFGGEVKPAVTCRFAACKRPLYVTWKSAFRQNSWLLFLAH